MGIAEIKPLILRALDQYEKLFYRVELLEAIIDRLAGGSWRTTFERELAERIPPQQRAEQFRQRRLSIEAALTEAELLQTLRDLPKTGPVQ